MVTHASSPTLTSRRMRHALTFVAALMLVLLAAAVRLHRLDAQSLWNDEGTSYVQSTRTLPEIADNAARDIHPPGYYALLGVWRLLFGETEFALRLLSAFAGILTVALTYALGKRLYSRSAGLAAGLVVALNTFNLYYSQETRMYALLGLWSIAALWAFVGFVRSRHQAVRWGIVLALCNAAGLYTHYAYPAVMLTQGVLFVVWLGAEWGSANRQGAKDTKESQRDKDDTNRQAAENTEQELRSEPPRDAGIAKVNGEGAQYIAPLRDTPSSEKSVSPLSFAHERGRGGDAHHLLLLYVALNFLTIALYLPWLPTALHQITTWPNTGQPIPTIDALAQIYGWFGLGITYAVSGSSVAIPFFLLFGLLSFPAQDGARTWWRMLVPVVWVILTLGGFLALGLFREANLKFLLPAQIGFALWLGRGVWMLWTLKPRRTAPIFQVAPRLAAAAGTISLVVALWSGLDPLYTAPQFQRDDYRGIVAQITANPRPDDAVILNAPGQIEVFRYYYGDAANVYPLPIGMTVDEVATLAAVREIIAAHGRIYAVLWGTTERDPHNLVENTLDQEAFEISSAWFGNVRLVRYAAPRPMGETVPSGVRFGEAITLQGYALNKTTDAPLRVPTDESSLPTYAPGDVLQVRLDWTTSAPISQRYKVFVQLLSPEGLVVSQHDSEPGGGTFPTINWIPGDTIADNHALIIPEDLPLAHYTLIIGLYNPDNPSQRVGIISDTGTPVGQSDLSIGLLLLQGNGE